MREDISSISTIPTSPFLALTLIEVAGDGCVHVSWGFTRRIPRFCMGLETAVESLEWETSSNHYQLKAG